MPQVSVIVPNYNHAPFLKQRIDSVLGQTFQDFELIILDDCSTDESRKVIDCYRNDSHVTQVVFNSENSGSAFRQWKKGIDLAEGEWVWIAESDDWAEPTFLEELLCAVNSDPQCVMAASVPCYVYPDGKRWHRVVDGKRLVYQGGEFVRQHLLEGNDLSNVSALLMNRNVLQHIDFSDIERMQLCGDWLLYAKLCTKGTVVKCNKKLSYFRQHGDNTSIEAEKNGLSLIEGVKVLDYITRTFNIAAGNYSKQWGRYWAKLERTYHYDKSLRKEIHNDLRGYSTIVFWHLLYKIKLAL